FRLTLISKPFSEESNARRCVRSRQRRRGGSGGGGADIAKLSVGREAYYTREGDPLLHTHLVIGNRVQGPDGHWTALDGRDLYRHRLAADAIYRARGPGPHANSGLPGRRRWPEAPPDEGIVAAIGVPVVLATVPGSRPTGSRDRGPCPIGRGGRRGGWKTH